MNGIEIKKNINGNTAELSISGDLAIRNLGIFKEHIEHLLEQGRSRIILDMAGVKYLDSAALGALIGFVGDARRLDGDVVLASLNEAILQFLSIIVRRGPSPLFGIVVADLAAARNHFQELDHRLEKLLSDEDAERLFNQGNRLRREKRLPSALALYEKAESLGGPAEKRKQVECAYHRGYCLYALGKYQESVPVLRRVIEMREEYSPAYRHLALALERIGEREEAARTLTLAHQRFPGDDFKTLLERMRKRESIPA